MHTADSIITWGFTSEAEEHAKTAAELTRGKLVLQVGETPVWNFSWTWVELLEWLSQNWTVLTAEQERPAGSSEEDEASWNFMQEHNLGAAVKGAQLPMVLIWRNGDRARIDISGTHVEDSWQSVENSLWRLGWYIASYLNEDDERSACALRSWKAVTAWD